MAFFTDVAALIPALCGVDAVIDDAETARAQLMLMPDADVVRVLAETASLAQQVEQIQVAAAGVIAVRSKRENGHSGLSASRGHKSAASLIQDATGSTKSEADRKARVGEALYDEGDGAGAGSRAVESGPEPAAGPGAGGDAGAGERCGAGSDAGAPAGPWHRPLRDAMQQGGLTSAQFDAIRRGLGDPPEVPADVTDADVRARAHESARAAWARAAGLLVDEASLRTVEELWQQARTIRDLLDPEGAEQRFLRRFENRSFRTYRGQDGQKRASMVLDDEGDVFLETVLGSALRPRRGGPRFVDPDEKAQAASLADDPRTNDQLAYDLIMDVIRAGALADAESVFGTRQAGVRLVRVVDDRGSGAPVAHSEDHLVAVPGAVADRRMCESGFVAVTVDSCGNPLDVGREQRLFTPTQRIALAVRDGGCRWRGCDRPASYCEAHHIDPYSEGGRTDIDAGILLCRYHHMTLHHGGWRITRNGKDDFMLHDSAGEVFAIRARGVLSYAWGGMDPPPRRFRPAA